MSRSLPFPSLSSNFADLTACFKLEQITIMSSSQPTQSHSARDSAGSTNDIGQPGQPLFESDATSPPPGSQRQQNHDPIAGHPHVEQMINATAKHVFPQQPGPNQRETGGSKDVSREGLPHVAHRNHPSSESQSQRPSSRRQSKAAGSDDEDNNDGEEKDPDQKPLMHGTPLDELKTPMFERSRGILDMKPAASPAAIGSGMSKISVQDQGERTPAASSSETGMGNVPTPRASATTRDNGAQMQSERPSMDRMGSVSFP
jgi:hypothetical protein